MKKNVLVLVGSPRTDGNSSMLADAYINGAKKAGHETVKLDIGKMDIKGCKACDTCFSKGQPCSFNDDFNKIAPYLEKADVIVFSTPIYWFTFPSELKAAIDKLYAFIIGKKQLKIKESQLLVCGEAKDEASFEGIIKSYEDIAAYEGWTNRGNFIVPGVCAKGDILSTTALEQVERLGTEL